MPIFVEGNCEDMCPQHEIKLRTKEHLLHFYELKRGQKNVPDVLVKEFSRSAAGLKAPRKTDLRTKQALHKTIDYLLKDIILDKRKPYNVAYDFIFDRLRCVRQEIVIQNFDVQTTIKLLEPIILFLAYSSYRLCSESISIFDPKICNQHLQECLKKALCCYDELELTPSYNETISQERNRCFIEALYQIFNLGSTEALTRGINLPEKVRNPLFISAFELSLNFAGRNYYKVLKGISQLPHLLCAVASIKLNTVRRKLFENFSHAYNSKQLSVPIHWLQNLLLYTDKFELIEDCKYYNIEIGDDKISVKFSKVNFDLSKSVLQSKHEKFVESKLKTIYLPEVFLLRRL